VSDPVLADAFPEARRLGETLRLRHLTVACAESCTGGLLGAALTAVAGSSDYVRGGVIAYSNSVKEALLGVPGEMLAQKGAVSAEVAEAMARGVLDAAGTDIGLAVTGVAGPGGGTAEKPVGLIWVAAVRRDGRVLVRRLDGDAGREANRARAVRAALEMGEELSG
jgi:nicotinamide-nucleotide amidase